MQAIRSWVVVLSVASAAASVSVLGLVAIPFFFGTAYPSPAAAAAFALGAIGSIALVRGVLSRRLTSTEEARPAEIHLRAVRPVLEQQHATGTVGTDRFDLRIGG